ncbi:hypothetical protein FB45DRAFT_902478, partial [Roridomyces roridus]
MTIPPSSSSLLALASLEPPSPILAPSAFSCSSEHIPILLPQETIPRDTSCGTFGPLNWGSTADDAPSPSTTACPSPPRLQQGFKFPSESPPPLTGSKSWITFVPPDADSTSTINTLAIPSLQHPPMTQQVLGSSCEEPFPLPSNLLWLRDATIQLMVDQEGFRTVHPTFKLVGIVKHERGWDSPEGGLALFRPVKREAFRFHYAPLDGLPILRRLTLANDDSRDYISRQASLSLKTNGVYTVQGVESRHLAASEMGDSKIRWKLDYLVGDRLEQSGKKILDGEKTLTPLTFLCSPWLLHPSQARKMKFMHFVKKSVATKLVAEKLEPASFLNASAKPCSNKWPLHRRVQSSSPHSEEIKPRKKTGSLRRAGPQDENQETRRRRRASSAGEGRRPVQSEYLKYIVPRSQLAELLNAEVGRRDGLSPAPRR